MLGAGEMIPAVTASLAGPTALPGPGRGVAGSAGVIVEEGALWRIRGISIAAPGAWRPMSSPASGLINSGIRRPAPNGMCAAFDREGFLEQVFPTPLGEGPGELLVAMRITELTIHAWDIAAATGQPRDLDPELVDFAEGFLRSRPIPRDVNGPFAPEQPAPAGAGDSDRLAAFAGRPVS
jgi:hypothetical protein